MEVTDLACMYVCIYVCVCMYVCAWGVYLYVCVLDTPIGNTVSTIHR